MILETPTKIWMMNPGGPMFFGDLHVGDRNELLTTAMICPLLN